MGEKNNSSMAGTDIINFLNKKDNYQKSLTANDDDADHTDSSVQPAVPQPAGKPGNVAVAEKQINAHFKAKGVTATEDGIKAGDTTLGISYSDMLMDLTRNYTRTQPNLTDADRKQVLALLKHTRMPVSYIRNKKLKDEYRQLLAGQPVPPQRVSIKRLRENVQAKYRKPTRRERPYLK